MVSDGFPGGSLIWPPLDSYLPSETDTVINYLQINAKVNLPSVSWRFRVVPWETISVC